MPDLTLAAVMLVLLAVIISAVGCTRPSAQTPPEAAPVASQPPPTERERLQAKLGALVAAPAPSELDRGAMCYAKVFVPEPAEFICPRCGARTQHQQSVAPRLREVVKARTAAAAVKGLKVTLDESEFCRKCTPEAPEAPALTLVVTFADGRIHRVRGVTPKDLQLISEFLAGADKHRGEQDQEQPLKDYAARLDQLLGLSQDAAK